MEMFTDKNFSQKFMGKLPEKIQQRLGVLLEYNKESVDLKSKYEAEKLLIRMKYDALFAPLYERRNEIISGASEAKDEEVEGGIPEDHKGKVSLTEGDQAVSKGIPCFWYRVLSNHCVISEMIMEEDEQLLSHLLDVSSRVLQSENESYEVKFTFEPNKFIKETELTISIESSESEVKVKKSSITFSDPHFLYEKDKPKKKPAAKGRANPPVVWKPRMSFFWIFVNVDEEDEELSDFSLNDTELLNFLHPLIHKVIPAAVNYFTGEKDGSSDLDDDLDEMEEEEDTDDS